MKKALKITGISLLIIIFLLAAIPFIFQTQIKDMLKVSINENVNAKVEFSDVSLSLLRSFPMAQVTINDLEITNFKPFKDETFAIAKSISFTMSVRELFKKGDDEPIIVNSITVDEALIILKTDASGNTNYDIAKEAENVNSSTSESSGFSFDIEDYSINNSAFTFIDETSNTTIYITELNHSGKGIFSAEISELDTNTEAKVSFAIDSTSYLNNTYLKLDALIELDLSTNTYTFKDNKGYINELPLEFKGYVKQLEDGQEIDIRFENPESSFKDFLAVIPKTYSKDLDNVTTTGDFKVKGLIKGVSSNKTIPKLDINIVSKNASFKYPDLPKRVENVSINTSIKNTTGNADDTYIDIKTLNFKIDDDVFKSSGTLKNITKNMLINANIDGTLNLDNITKAYPIELDKALSGILKAKLNTSFDMNAIETNAYNRIKNKGNMSVSNFVFSSEDIVNPIHISKADLTFNSETVTLNNFNATTGESDFRVTGTIKNLIGFLLSDKNLQGNFNINSNNFVVSDFMVKDEFVSNDNKTTSNAESLKIPAFLDCTFNVNAKNVVYDNLNLKDVKGILIIKNQKATLKNMTSNLFDGNLAVNGNVSTQTNTPTFNLDLGANEFDISKSFNGMALLQSLAPIAKAVQGKLNTTINLSGTLDKTFSPNLESVSGNAFAELISSTINPLNTKILGELGNTLNFIDFKKLDLTNLKTSLEFANGNVIINPFSLKYEDIDIEVSGSHNSERKLAYNAVFNVPAKYLGSEVNQLIGKLDDAKAGEIKIPITANITGTFANPSVKTDLTSAVSNLTKQLIEIEKQKLLNKGTGEVKTILGGILGGNSTSIDSSKVDSISTKGPIIKGVKDALGGLLGRKKKKKDTIKN